MDTSESVASSIQMGIVADLKNSHNTMENKLDEIKSRVDKVPDFDERFQPVVAEIKQGIANQVAELESSIHERFCVEPPPPIMCAGTPGWRQVAYVNLTDPSYTCPPGWDTDDETQLCVKMYRDFCSSTTFSISGGEYSRVCGRVVGFRNDLTEAFYREMNIDSSYADGVSITHGRSPRQHIWTFTAGSRHSQYLPAAKNCPCADSRLSTPSFVGTDYFCEYGDVQNMNDADKFHLNDPLWDGKSCYSDYDCCSLNDPPYFEKELPSPTSDDIEARICGRDSSRPHILVKFMELYVQ